MSNAICPGRRCGCSPYQSRKVEMPDIDKQSIGSILSKTVPFVPVERITREPADPSCPNDPPCGQVARMGCTLRSSKAAEIDEIPSDFAELLRPLSVGDRRSGGSPHTA